MARYYFYFIFHNNDIKFGQIMHAANNVIGRFVKWIFGETTMAHQLH